MYSKDNNQQLLRDYISEAYEYYISGRYDKVNAVADKILGLDNSNMDGLRFKLSVLLEFSKFEESLQVIDRLIEKDPEYQEAYYQKGLMLYKLKRYNESNECFNRIYEMNPEIECIDVFVEHAKVLMEICEYKKALWLCEYSKRNKRNGFYFEEDEIKLEIHRRIISDFERNGLFGHKYVFKNVEHMQYIQANNDYVKITVPGKDIVFDGKGDIIIQRKELFTISELKENFNDLLNSNFLEWLTNDNYELKNYYGIDNETKVLVKPIYYLNAGDEIFSTYFAGDYQLDCCVYEEGVHEVLLGTKHLGYVFKSNL